MALMVSLVPQAGNAPDIANLLQRVNTGFNQINDTFSGAATARGQTVGPFVLDNVTINPSNPGAGKFTTISASGQITSTVTTGTAPFVVASTTVVSNLNAALLNGTTWTAPGAIGGGTPAAGSFTTGTFSSTVTGATSLGVGTSSTTRLVNLVDNQSTDIPICLLTNNTTGNFVQAYHAIFPNAVGGQNIAGFSVGQAWSSKNAGYFGVNWTSSGSNSNYAQIGMHSQDGILKCFADGTASFKDSLTAKSFIPSSATIPTNGVYLGAANTTAISSNSTLALSVTIASAKANVTWNAQPTSSAGLAAGTLYQGAANAAFFA